VPAAEITRAAEDAVRGFAPLRDRFLLY
jgi:hypothetical protein